MSPVEIAWCPVKSGGDPGRTHAAARARIDGLLRALMSDLWPGVERQSWVIVRDRDRRPWVAAPVPVADISIAHDDGVAIVAVAREGHVGLDVERVPTMIPPLHEVSPAFGAIEWGALARMDPRRRAAAFATAWTVKEAAAKLDGRGLAADFRRIIAAPFVSTTAATDVRGYRWTPLRGHRAAIVIEGGLSAPRIRRGHGDPPQFFTTPGEPVRRFALASGWREGGETWNR